MSLKIFPNFRTVTQWITESAKYHDCRCICSGCLKKWNEIKEGNVHMMEAAPDDKTPCGLEHKWYCDGCIEEVKNNNPT